jgi:hypothetical protein
MELRPEQGFSLEQGQGSWFETNRQKHETLSEKQTKSKRAGAEAHMAEHLPSKREAL